MPKSEDLSRKTAVISGGSSGIGRATAIQLASMGYDVVICARRESELRQVVEEITAGGGRAAFYACDVSNSREVQGLAGFVEQRMGTLDLLFNNAGTGPFVSLEETSDDLWDSTISICLGGTFLMCRAFLPLLSKSERAIIINNASVAAQRGFPGWTAYSAAKGGVAAFSRSLREELRPDGIRVCTLYAGATDSEFWKAAGGEWDRSRMMSCQDIAKMIAAVADSRGCASVDELTIAPAGGPL